MKEFAESANKPVTRENSTPYVLACMEKAKKKHPWMQLNPLASVQELLSLPVKNGIFRGRRQFYVVYSSGWDQKRPSTRLKLFIRITRPARDKDGTLILASVSSASREQLAATAIAAAKYYAKDTGATSISVVLDSLPDVDGAAASLRLRITYPTARAFQAKKTGHGMECGLPKRPFPIRN